MNEIRRLVKKNKYAYGIVYIFFRILGWLGNILFLVMRIFPVKKNKIVCSNMKGKRYGDNPKYITDEVIKQKLDCEIVWLLNPDFNEDLPKEVRRVDNTPFKMAYELATAGIWIDSNTKPLAVLKRKQQHYIQTWHGSYGLKKMYKDIPEKITLFDIKNIEHNVKMQDLMISNSVFTTEIYRRAFGYDGKVIECGSPRNDIFFQKPNAYIEKVSKYFRIKGKKIALYAPTFRSDFNIDVFDIEFECIKNALQKRFGGEWVILIRMHPNNIRDAGGVITYSQDIINATEYNVMQELLVASDVLISDYSSCILDFVTKEKVCFLYASDIEKYALERDLYFNIYELPFPVAENNEELEKNILQFNEAVYHKKLRELFQQVGLNETGKASQKVVEQIKRWLE